VQASKAIIVGYLALGVPGNERNLTSIYTKLDAASDTTDLMMASLKSLRPLKRFETDAPQAAIMQANSSFTQH